MNRIRVGSMATSKGRRLLLLGIVLVVIDQAIKILVKTNMSLGDHFNVLGNWFQILFIENEGMAFGMKFGGLTGKFLLTLFRLVLFGVLCWWIASLLRRQVGEDGSPALWKDGTALVPDGLPFGLTLITAGALGNILDSLFYGVIFGYAPLMFGKVVDMFYFPLIETDWPSWMPFVGGKHFIFFAPVFNFADNCVTVGAFYLILFQHRFFLRDEEKKKAGKD